MSDTRYETHIRSAATKANQICGVSISPIELTWITSDDLDIMESDPADEEDGSIIDDADALEIRSSEIYFADLMESIDHSDCASEISDSEETLNAEPEAIGQKDELLPPDSWRVREPVLWMKISDLSVRDADQSYSCAWHLLRLPPRSRSRSMTVERCRARDTAPSPPSFASMSCRNIASGTRTDHSGSTLVPSTACRIWEVN